MNGAIGSYVKAATVGVPTARKHLKGVFCEPFQSVAGWQKALAPIPGGDVETLLDRHGAWWTRECFQALYVACWIFHPVEKGSYMIQLTPRRLANVRDAYDGLLAAGELTARISSHLSKKGASAHQGWAFLKGYEELLVQIEGEGTGSPYLFLKCEGHALSGFGLSTILHGASWVKKTATGSGATASPALKRLAGNTANVEARAAENFSTSYKKVLKRLGLSGKMVTVEDMLEAMHGKAGFTGGLPPQIKGNTHLLGRAMLGPSGYIALFRRRKDELRKNRVKWDDDLERELTDLAERMVATSVAHPQQYFNEIRVSPLEVTGGLRSFQDYLT